MYNKGNSSFLFVINTAYYYSWVSVTFSFSSSRSVLLSIGSMRHSCNKLSLATERIRLVCDDGRSALLSRRCWLKSSKTSRSSVRSSRFCRMYTFLSLGGFRKKGRNGEGCEQVGISFLATTTVCLELWKLDITQNTFSSFDWKQCSQCAAGNCRPWHGFSHFRRGLAFYLKHLFWKLFVFHV